MVLTELSNHATALPNVGLKLVICVCQGGLGVAMMLINTYL